MRDEFYILGRRETMLFLLLQISHKISHLAWKFFDLIPTLQNGSESYILH